MSRVLENAKNQITCNYNAITHKGIDLVKYKSETCNIIAHTEGKVILIQTGQKNDKNTIIATMRTTLGKIPKYANLELDESVVWNYLIFFARKYLHLSLCFSPSSEKFREKFIKFPVLFSSVTIVWLLPWPEEALISVAKGAIENNKNLKYNHYYFLNS